MPFTRLYRVGVWFRVVRFALLLVVVLSWVLLSIFCPLRVAHGVQRSKRGSTDASVRIPS